jgi:predicted PurR-regulated permease PerM
MADRAQREPDTRRIYVILFFIAATLALGWASLRILKPFSSAIAWAIVLAVGFQSPWQALQRRLLKRPGLAAGLATTAIALVVLLPATLFLVSVTTQAVDAANQVSAKLTAHNVQGVGDLRSFPRVASALDWIGSHAGLQPDEVEAKARELGVRASTFVAERSGALVLGIFDAVLSFAMTLFLLFFFLRDGDALASGALALIPISTAARAEMRGSLSGMLGSIFRGSLLGALAQGALGGLGWWIAGLPSPALAGAAMGVLSLVPLGGTALVWLPGSIWLWTEERHGMAIFLFAWGAVLVSFVADNILKPLLMRGTDELSTLIVFLGVFGGLAAFGLLGIFIGPIVLVLATELLETLRRSASPEPAAESPASSAGGGTP